MTAPTSNPSCTRFGCHERGPETAPQTAGSPNRRQGRAAAPPYAVGGLRPCIRSGATSVRNGRPHPAAFRRLRRRPTGDALWSSGASIGASRAWTGDPLRQSRGRRSGGGRGHRDHGPAPPAIYQTRPSGAQSTASLDEASGPPSTAIRRREGDCAHRRPSRRPRRRASRHRRQGARNAVQGIPAAPFDLWDHDTASTSRRHKRRTAVTSDQETAATYECFGIRQHLDRLSRDHRRR